MLRGRSHCAILGRPKPSSAPKYPLSPIIPVRLSRAKPRDTQKQGGGALLLNFQPSTLNCLSPRTPLIPPPLATAALRVVPAPTFTTTSSIHVGAPTILLRERTTASKQFPDRRALLFPNCALLTVDCELLFSPKSSYSCTYEPVSHKSNYSRTYAKQGGGGRVSHW